MYILIIKNKKKTWIADFIQTVNTLSESEYSLIIYLFASLYEQQHNGSLLNFSYLVFIIIILA